MWRKTCPFKVRNSVTLHVLPVNVAIITSWEHFPKKKPQDPLVVGPRSGTGSTEEPPTSTGRNTSRRHNSRNGAHIRIPHSGLGLQAVEFEARLGHIMRFHLRI